MKHVMNRIDVLLLIVLVAFAEGCASTLQARPAHEPRFSEGNATLATAPGGMTPHVHGRSGVEWSAYDKIHLKPIVVRDDLISQLSREQEEDLKRLANAFYDMLARKLSQDYVLVERPAPGTMRLEVVITHAEQSWVAPAVLSKVSWQLQILNAVWTSFRGKPAFAGEVSLEFAVRDSVTEELLFAGADRRVGGQNLFNKELFNSWGDVQNSLEFWTAQSVYQLCVARRGANCTPPKA